MWKYKFTDLSKSLYVPLFINVNGKHLMFAC